MPSHAIIGGEPYPGDLDNNRAMIAIRRGDAPVAERHLRAAIAAVEGDPERRYALLHYSINLVAAVATQGRLDEARELGARALAIANELYGEAHPNTLRAEINAANVELAAGRIEQARAAAERVITRWSRLERPVDEAVAHDLHARALHRLERPRACLVPAERALELRRASLPSGDPLIPRTLGILAGCQLDAGLTADALRSVEEARSRLGPVPVDPELAAELEEIRALALRP